MLGANVGRCWIHFSCCIFVFGDFHVFLLNSAFPVLYEQNQGLEVFRETRLEKLMRLLGVSSKIYGGKLE